MRRMLVLLASIASLLAVATPALANDCTSVIVTSVCLPPILPKVPSPQPSTPTQSPIPGPPQHLENSGPTKTSAPVVTPPAKNPESHPPVVKSSSPPPGVKAAQPPQPSQVTPVQPPVHEVTKTVIKTKTISVPKAVGLSIGTFLLGIILALGSLYAVYIIGRREGEGVANELVLKWLGSRRKNLEKSPEDA